MKEEKTPLLCRIVCFQMKGFMPFTLVPLCHEPEFYCRFKTFMSLKTEFFFAATQFILKASNFYQVLCVMAYYGKRGVPNKMFFYL